MSLASDYNNLGLIKYEKGYLSDAKEYYEKAINLTRKKFGDGHFNLAIYYSNYGVVL